MTMNAHLQQGGFQHTGTRADLLERIFDLGLLIQTNPAVIAIGDEMQGNDDIMDDKQADIKAKEVE